MESNERVVCECCDLDTPRRLAPPIVNAFELVRGRRCRMCNEHQGDPLQAAFDHEQEVRIRWDDTVTQLHSALDRADDYKAKMLAALQVTRQHTETLREARPFPPGRQSRVYLRDTQL